MIKQNLEKLITHFKSLNGFVVRIHEGIGVQAVGNGLYYHLCTEDLSWGIVDVNNGGLMHYFTIYSDGLFGFRYASYIPMMNIPEVSDSDGGLNIKIFDSTNHDFSGIYSFRKLGCDFEEYDSCLLRILKTLRLQESLDLKQSGPISKYISSLSLLKSHRRILGESK